jgi:hypothetical protein
MRALVPARGADAGQAEGDSHFMSDDVIVIALLGIGLHTIAGNGAAFANFSRG